MKKLLLFSLVLLSSSAFGMFSNKDSNISANTATSCNTPDTLVLRDNSIGDDLYFKPSNIDLALFEEALKNSMAIAIVSKAEERKKHPERSYSDEAISDIRTLFTTGVSNNTIEKSASSISISDDSYDDYMKDRSSK